MGSRISMGKAWHALHMAEGHIVSNLSMAPSAIGNLFAHLPMPLRLRCYTNTTRTETYKDTRFSNTHSVGHSANSLLLRSYSVTTAALLRHNLYRKL